MSGKAAKKSELWAEVKRLESENAEMKQALNVAIETGKLISGEKSAAEQRLRAAAVMLQGWWGQQHKVTLFGRVYRLWAVPEARDENSVMTLSLVMRKGGLDAGG